jgi:hypothetical protein
MKKQKDIFADIAAQQFKARAAGLVEPQPPKLKDKCLPLDGLDAAAVVEPLEKMHTPEQLQQELERMRGQYVPYMQDFVPALPAVRSAFELTDFSWRKETDEDVRDFSLVLSGKGDWESVVIPHYGAPLGVAVTYYRASFSLDAEQLSKGALYVCFKGVDYKAHVFMNGSYLGSHEGFFAPFEFDFERHANVGDNTLVVKVENDFICMGNADTANLDEKTCGDKIYAATGPGYDDPEIGWHHCPPGMGIYQTVTIESRSRSFISDIFVRPLMDKHGAEVWVEAFNSDLRPMPVSFALSLYGQNFRQTVFEDIKYFPLSTVEDEPEEALKDAKLRGAGIMDRAEPLLLEKGINFFKVFILIPRARLWEPDSPWLYQLQVKLRTETGAVADAARRQFGMRSFCMEAGDEPKGRFYLNGKPVRLRGANTMGHEQQCVMKKDWSQLRDDILLAKICHMNFLRLTQRPVQEEVYEFCDRLGLMTQTDLPLFSVLRANQTMEAARQAGEMEHLVRSHPCNILVTFINEPFPNSGNKPHRYLSREHLTTFFEAAGIAVHLQNPDRVIKPVDGDYDPPAPGLPDNHCYTCWYNGHGVDFGKLHRGFWQPVKEGWNHACGEFGAEGLDPVVIMRKYYPAHWLPQNPAEEESWSPGQIVRAQTEAFYRFFFERQHTLADWVHSSHAHQAWATRMMTEAFRRDNRMVSFAIHLFIDAFPSGWMKTIMDVERQPKPAYFAYREALTPLMANLRTDRFKVFSGEQLSLEAWVCNDRADVPEEVRLHYRVDMGGETLLAAQTIAEIQSCSSQFQGFITFTAPSVQSRTTVVVSLALADGSGVTLHDCHQTLEVFPAKAQISGKTVRVVTCFPEGPAAQLAKELNLEVTGSTTADLILMDSFDAFLAEQQSILQSVKKGATAVFLELPPGQYELQGSIVTVKPCAMFPVYFVSRDTGHKLVDGFLPDDFRLWYDPELGRLSPLLDCTFTGEGFAPVLTSGNKDDEGQWQTELAVAVKTIGRGSIALSQVKLAGRMGTNPVARQFAMRLLGLE